MSRLQLELLEDRSVPATITVTIATDTAVMGSVTLRQAITSINNGADLNADVTANRVGAYGTNDTIIFNIGNAPQKITVKGTPLPAITNSVTIDGTPPTGAGNRFQTIEIFGGDPSLSIKNQNQQPVNGLTVQTGATGSDSIYGLTIDNFTGDGILLNNAANVQLGASNGMPNSRGNAIADGKGVNAIYSNGTSYGDGIDITGASSTNDSVIASFIGTNKNSAPNLGNNKGDGIDIHQGANGNHIGPGSLGKAGTVGGDGINLISGNQLVGVSISGPNNTVAGNMIGTDATGMNLLANGFGVAVWGSPTTNTSGTTIGGQAIVTKNIITTPVNVISGNSNIGVWLNSCSGVSVQGNYIGTNKNGTDPLPNGSGIVDGLAASAGVELIASSGAATGNLIGGSQPSLGNVISGNKGDGIRVPGGADAPAQKNTIQDNWIGTASDGVTKLPNTGIGVNFSGAGASQNTVISNTINNNNGKGYADPNKQNKIDGSNKIASNTGPGIYTDGTYNGSPVLTSAVVLGNSITIQGTLASTPNSSFILEFFGDLNPVAPGNEQGEVFLGTITVSTDTNGNASFTATFNAVYGNYVSATATGTADTGYTSQFSAYVPITGESSLAAVGGVVWNDLNQNGQQDSGEPGIGGVPVQLLDANNNLIATTTSNANGQYFFTNLAPGQYYVQFTLPAGFAFTDPYQGNNALNSHADPLTGQTELFTLINGQVDPFLSAGLVATS